MDVSVSRSPLTIAVTRSRRYLTTATLLLVGVTITLVSVLSVAQHSLQRVRSDFTDNLLARVMTVTQSFGTDGLQPLNRAAVQSIETVAAVGTQVPGFTAVQFELGGGVEDERGRVRHVLGVDDDGSRLFGLPDTPATVAFALDGSTGATSLRIPVVEVGDDGYTAHDSRTIGLTLEAVPTQMRQPTFWADTLRASSWCAKTPFDTSPNCRSGRTGTASSLGGMLGNYP